MERRRPASHLEGSSPAHPGDEHSAQIERTLAELGALRESLLAARDTARASSIPLPEHAGTINRAEKPLPAEGVAEIPERSSRASPYEVAERYAAGEIDRAEMIRQLSACPYAKAPEHSEQLSNEWKAILPPDQPGTFGEVGEAFDRGLIDAEAFDLILHASEDAQATPEAP